MLSPVCSSRPERVGPSTTLFLFHPVIVAALAPPAVINPNPATARAVTCVKCFIFCLHTNARASDLRQPANGAFYRAIPRPDNDASAQAARPSPRPRRNQAHECFLLICINASETTFHKLNVYQAFHAAMRSRSGGFGTRQARRPASHAQHSGRVRDAGGLSCGKAVRTRA